MHEPKWKIIIVGESKEACHNLKNLLESTTSVEILVAVCCLKEAVSTLQRCHKFCDLLFLQVNLSDGNIFDVLDLVEGIQVPMIFLSDNNVMRHRAEKYNAFYYATKPFSVESFLAIFEELKQKSPPKQENDSFPSMPTLVNNTLHVKANGVKHMIPTNGIVYIFGEGNYTTFQLESGNKLLISKPLIQLERLLSTYQFYRIHQSYLVNRYQITNVKYGTKTFVTLNNGDKCPIARRKKKGFVAWLSLSPPTSHT